METMNIASWVIVALLAVWFVLALRAIVRTRKRGGCMSCGGSCSGCGGGSHKDQSKSCCGNCHACGGGCGTKSEHAVREK